MSGQPIRKPGPTGNERQDRANQALAADVERALRSPLLRGEETPVVTFATGGVAVKVAHRLGRTPRGYVDTDVQGGYARFTREAWDDMTITLMASVACKARFWVY